MHIVHLSLHFSHHFRSHPLQHRYPGQDCWSRHRILCVKSQCPTIHLDHYTHLSNPLFFNLSLSFQTCWRSPEWSIRTQERGVSTSSTSCWLELHGVPWYAQQLCKICACSWSSSLPLSPYSDTLLLNHQMKRMKSYTFLQHGLDSVEGIDDAEEFKMAEVGQLSVNVKDIPMYLYTHPHVLY